MKKMRKISALSVIVFVCSILWLMPLLLIFINSFKPYNDMIQDFLALPKSWDLDKYIETWTNFNSYADREYACVYNKHSLACRASCAYGGL